MYKLEEVFGKMGAVIFSVDGLRDTNHIYQRELKLSKYTRFMRIGRK